LFATVSCFISNNNSIEVEVYQQAIVLYIKERSELHTKLIEKGCEAISIESEIALAKGSENSIHSLIVILQHHFEFLIRRINIFVIIVS